MTQNIRNMFFIKVLLPIKTNQRSAPEHNSPGNASRGVRVCRFLGRRCSFVVFPRCIEFSGKTERNHEIRPKTRNAGRRDSVNGSAFHERFICADYPGQRLETSWLREATPISNQDDLAAGVARNSNQATKVDPTARLSNSANASLLPKQDCHDLLPWQGFHSKIIEK